MQIINKPAKPAKPIKIMSLSKSLYTSYRNKIYIFLHIKLLYICYTLWLNIFIYIFLLLYLHIVIDYLIFKFDNVKNEKS